MKNGMKCTNSMLLRLPLAGLLQFVALAGTLGTAVFLFGGCGIASYPYLVPPESVSAGDGFEHQSQVTSGVFRGYEIYYRIYAGSVSEETIIEDLQSAFQNRSGFEEVSEERDRGAALSAGETSPVDSPYWLAVASTSDTPPGSSNLEGEIGSDSPPLFPIEQTYGGANSFDVSMTTESSGSSELSILDSDYPTGDPDDYPKEIYLYRRVSESESDTVLGFTDTQGDYIAASDSDGHADVPEELSESDPVTIAFFSIIYGFDVGSFTTIFANSYLGLPTENIVFMGTVTPD